MWIALNEGRGTILDCFAGTSTVGQFALTFNSKFIGYDMNPNSKASEVRLHKNENYYIPINSWELISKNATFSFGDLTIQKNFDLSFGIQPPEDEGHLLVLPRHQ
jgi:hypothetical protein